MAEVFYLIGCKSLSPSFVLPSFVNNNNNNVTVGCKLLVIYHYLQGKPLSERLTPYQSKDPNSKIQADTKTEEKEKTVKYKKRVGS